MKILKAFLIVLLMLTATAGGAGLRILEWSRPAPSGPGDFSPANAANPAKLPAPLSMSAMSGDILPGEAPPDISDLPQNFYVLLIGLDELDGGRRADAIAFAVVDRPAQSVRILSIPRDSRVSIPGRNWDKINHAYSYGGLELLKRTVMNLFNVGIDYSLVLNYDSFPRIIDLLGGVDIYVDKKMSYTDYSQKLFINIPQGQQHLNGKKSLEYVRFRHDPLGDVGRVQRQQKFISNVMERLKSPLIIPRIPDLLSEAVAAVQTDMSFREALQMLWFVNSLERDRVKITMAPGKAAYLDNISYWLLDVLACSNFITGEIEDDAFLAQEETLPADLNQGALWDLVQQIGQIGILNGDGEGGLSKRASQVFQKIGVNVAYTGNAKHFDYHTSNVIYPENAREADKQAAAALAELCGITNKSLVKWDRGASMVSVVLGHDKESIIRRLEGVTF